MPAQRAVSIFFSVVFESNQATMKFENARCACMFESNRVSGVLWLPVRYFTACARRHFALFGETPRRAIKTRLRRRDGETRRRIEAPYNCLTSSLVLTSSVALALPPAIASATPPWSRSPLLGSPLPPPSVLARVLERTRGDYSTKSDKMFVVFHRAIDIVSQHEYQVDYHQWLALW